MIDVLLYSAFLTFALGLIIMYLIPEKLFPKKFYNEARLSQSEVLRNSIKPGYYRKLFLICGSVLILTLLLVKYNVL
jgi:hypothetical protein